jgi:hypothetical protein
MSTQLITSDLFVDLCTEEQQLLSGGYKKSSGGCGCGNEETTTSTPSPSMVLGYKITAVPFSYCGTGDTSEDTSKGTDGVM